MRTPLIELTDAPDPADIAAIRAGLSQYNAAASGVDDQRPLAVLVKDPDTQQVLGGITGRTSRGMFFLEVFFLPESLRGNGIGSQALKMAEQEGWRRGCQAALLHTNTFQAPEFYRRNGWREIASIPSGPAGNCRVIFTKELGPDH
ncbi:MAG TPA: GNAT family N-acetyltransferase [Dyella sp.]|uniref:GNAT family N-acetyltransferase n=1 Tax=Dyella sp. TaxID=1869338 RepID=UPI002B883B53|nr:GNAT family N-acetyltransferase [Dyella sp.]HTV85349.1 GNAT family N-acetyltransferase [Dyella sp.]